MLQAGLAPIRERLYRETVGRYGFRKEFAGADAETMMEVLQEIKKRLVCAWDSTVHSLFVSQPSTPFIREYLQGYTATCYMLYVHVQGVMMGKYNTMML